mgnify:CR=1 FL=1
MFDYQGVATQENMKKITFEPNLETTKEPPTLP